MNAPGMGPDGSFGRYPHERQQRRLRIAQDLTVGVAWVLVAVGLVLDSQAWVLAALVALTAWTVLGTARALVRRAEGGEQR